MKSNRELSGNGAAGQFKANGGGTTAFLQKVANTTVFQSDQETTTKVFIKDGKSTKNIGRGKDIDGNFLQAAKEEADLEEESSDGSFYKDKPSKSDRPEGEEDKEGGEQEQRDAKRAKVEHPKKADYRQRAHCNPLNDWASPYPRSPDHVDWSVHFPDMDLLASEEPKLQCNTHDYPISYPTEPLFPLRSIGADAANGDAHLSVNEQLNNLHILSDKDRPAAASASASASSSASTAKSRARGQGISKSKSGAPEDKVVKFLDIGCGFGGLLIGIAEEFPDKLALGIEIREQVTNYVGQRIIASRREYKAAIENGESGKDMKVDVGASSSAATSAPKTSLPHFYNVSIIRTNAMKLFQNYFRQAQLEKLFFCFPDPHFKKKNWRRRIINKELLDVYAYCMVPGGKIFTITDVEDLHNWMAGSLEEHPCFKKLKDHNSGKPDKDGKPTEAVKLSVEDETCVQLIHDTTEEGKKVKALGRFGKMMYYTVYEKVAEPKEKVEGGGEKLFKPELYDLDTERAKRPGDKVYKDYDALKERTKAGARAASKHQNAERDKKQHQQESTQQALHSDFYRGDDDQSGGDSDEDGEDGL